MQKPILHVMQNLAPAELHGEIWQATQGKQWYFGNFSNTGQPGTPFWKMDLEDCAPVTQLWKHAQAQCETVAGRTLRVVRQYANGHTFGQGGQPHIDDVREGTFTLLYYPMPEWRAEWEGETMWVDRNGEVISALRPQPNRGVLFDARIPHYGKAPSRGFTGLRVTIAFKLEPA